MSTCACVFSKSGKRLMPTIRLGKVRHLLKDGKAKIIKHHPFTIQLLYDSETNIQPIEICEDVGYNYIGISVKSQSHEYVSVQYDTLQDEKDCHDSCRKMRRIDNHFNCGGMIFFLWCLALHGVSYSRQSPWYLQAPPSRPAPHTASRSYPED